MNKPFSVETMQDLSRGPTHNLFSGKDHQIVRKALSTLQTDEQAVVILRFWEKNTIAEIANILDLTWNEAEDCLTRALLKLKKVCLSNSNFSRSKQGLSNERGVA